MLLIDAEKYPCRECAEENCSCDCYRMDYWLTTPEPAAFIGKDFTEWCSMEPDDNRTIHYHLYHHMAEPETGVEFTSLDEIDPITMVRVQMSYIEDMQLVDDEWHVTLCY